MNGYSLSQSSILGFFFQIQGRRRESEQLEMKRGDREKKIEKQKSGTI